MAAGNDGRRSWGYLVNSDNDDEEQVCSRRTSTTTELSSYTYDERSSDDESTFSSIAGEELMMYDDEVYRNISRMLHKGLRRSRPTKKPKDRDLFLAKQHKTVQKQNASRRRSKDLSTFGTMEDDLFLSDSQELASDDGKKTDHQKRKRSVEQLRTSERDAKWEIGGMRLDSPDGQTGSPSLPTQASVKVEQTNHFKSLNSKPVIPKELNDCDGSRTPPKMQVEECPQDRQDFWVLFSLLIRMGNPDRKNKEVDCNFTRPVRAPPDPQPPPVVVNRSQEEHVWQNKLNDLIWLSLRAWHSGRSIRDEDHVLCNERETIKAVLDEVMNFTFRPTTPFCAAKDCSSILPTESVSGLANASESEAQSGANSTEETAMNETSTKPRRPRLEIPLPGLIYDETANWNPGYSCCGLCGIFCETCLENQNNALAQVKDLLDRLDEVERLYPSSRAMRKDWDLYKSPEFTGRVKSLCLFYNLVTDLRHKIATLGKMQASIGSKNLPWPSFAPSQHGTVDSEDAGSTCHPSSSSSSSVDGVTIDVGAAGNVSPSGTCERRERKSSKCVRFQASAALNLRVDPNGSQSGGSDSGYGPASVTPTSLSPATEVASPTSSPVSGREAWSWSAAGTPSQSASSTPLSNKYPGFISPTYCRSVSEQSSEGTYITPYRRYVDKLLKTKGLRKIFMALMELIRTTLVKAKTALEINPKQTVVTSPDLPKLGAEDASSLAEPKPPPPTPPYFSEESIEELRRYGLWGETFQQMALPSFRSLYMFLSQIPLDVMHECLQLRLEQQPKGPSSLSVRQLMRECKEAIKAAVVIRQKFLRMTRTVLFKSEMDKIEQDMVEFDSKVERMFQSYLSYFQSWVQMLLKSSTQQTQKNVLEDEWTFVKVFSRYIQRGEALACETFCSLACSMFESTGDNLDADLDKCTSLLYDSISSDQDVSSSRQSIWQCCREYKDAFQEARKRALKAISFAKMLRKDLEIAAEFRIECCIGKLLDKLRETGHVRLIAPHSSCFIIFIPDHVKDNRLYLWQLLSMTYGHEHSAAPDNADHEGYLIILRCEDCGLIPGPWSGPTIEIEPTAEITITLSCLNVEGLLLVVNHSSQLSVQRKAFQKAMGCMVTLAKEFTSCNQYIAESLADLKREGISLQCKLTKTIRDVEDRLNIDSVSDIEDADRANLQSRFREVLHHCYKFGFEYQKEVTRLVTGESRSELGLGLISFANQWMRFVLERCERGRGVRPRWANQGLDFLMTACEPQYLKTVSDEDFQQLKLTMNDCIAHLIGSANNKLTPSPGGIGSRSHSPTPHSKLNFRQSSFCNEQSSSRLPRASSSLSVKSEPTLSSSASSNLLSPWSVEDTKPQRDTEEDVEEGNGSDQELPMARIWRAIEELDGAREERLRSSNMIGSVRDVLVETTIHINARRVTFRWQRGNKIGQGRFGKVYTAVNTDTGELMALKEIHLQPNDHKTIKEVTDELRIFEGIKHLRDLLLSQEQEEMFIFMEYCDYGTLEHAAQLGLPEPQVRKYTRQLLDAVCILHEHGIVHRDIKGANIFLTTDGNLKLGDFGCCIKLKNHTTMPGELNSFVGTQAFMAPEVFTKTVTEGHGRAADIWSIGCVVLEMATGHRPWHELENNYQIMFKVGMGETPEIPYTLSQEGQDFLSHCFKFDPRERWTAISLLDHPFTKVDSDDDLQSMTFLPDAHLLLQKLACP